MKDAFYALLAVGVAMMAAGAALSASARYTGAFVGTGAAAASDTGSGLILLGASAASVGVVGESVHAGQEPPQRKRQPRKVLEIITEGHEVDDAVGRLAPGLDEEVEQEKDAILRRIREGDEDIVFVEYTEGEILNPYSLKGRSRNFLIDVLKAAYKVGAEVLPLESDHLSAASRHLYNRHQDHITKDIVDYGAYTDIVERIDRALGSINELRTARDPKSNVYGQTQIKRRVAEDVNAVVDAIGKYRHGGPAGDAARPPMISPMDDLGDERLKVIKARMIQAKDALEQRLKISDLKNELYQLDSKTLSDTRERDTIGPGIVGYLAKGYLKNPDRKAIAVVGAEHGRADSKYFELLKKSGVEYTVHDLSANYRKNLKSNLDKNL